MNKKTFVILPDYATDIILSILKSFSLEEKNKEQYQKLMEMTDADERSSFYDQIPSINVARITRKIKTNEIQDQEAVNFLAEKMPLDKVNAEKMLTEIKNKLVAFSKVVEEESAPEKKTETKEEVVEGKGSLSEEFSKIKTSEKKGPDSYREIIE